MTADSITNEAEQDPVAVALADPHVECRMIAAARVFLGRRDIALTSIQKQEEATEIVSKVRVEAWKQRKSYDANRDVVAWLIGFIFNVVRDHVRKHARNPIGPPPDIPSFEECVIDSGQSASDIVENKETVERLLGQLSSQDRRIIEMRIFEDLTFAEIAERLEMNENAARIRCYRILKRLRELGDDSREVQS
jgi:RNA polymerase sigma factor (sigma-70 family)